ncbi:unnamed protein product, partial [Prunus brigantina]
QISLVSCSGEFSLPVLCWVLLIPCFCKVFVSSSVFLGLYTKRFGWVCVDLYRSTSYVPYCG